MRNTLKCNETALLDFGLLRRPLRIALRYLKTSHNPMSNRKVMLRYGGGRQMSMIKAINERVGT